MVPCKKETWLVSWLEGQVMKRRLQLPERKRGPRETARVRAAEGGLRPGKS